MRLLRSCLVVALATTGLFGLAAAPAGAATTTCTFGDLAPGTYGSLVIDGFCALPATGTLTVTQSLTVTSKGVLDGIKESALVVHGNVTVKEHGVLLLGCSPDIGCARASSMTIGQSLRADKALAVILHFVTVNGNIAINGGGGGTTCAFNPIVGAPAYVVLEDSRVGQSVSITNLKTCWMGIIRNTVNGNVTDTNNTFADPDANEIVSNTIGQSLTCTGNSPAAQVGDSGGTPNRVRGHKNGECAAL